MELILAYDRTEEMQALIREYTDAIRRQGDEVAQCLDAQHLEEELDSLAEKYGPPGGRMYLALVDGKTAGCVALTKNDGTRCELKRLYVRPEFRGLHVGAALLERVIQEACQIGYRYMRLDTFPFMDRAIRMYERRGFVRVRRYNDNPAETAVFLELELHGSGHRGDGQRDGTLPE